MSGDALREALNQFEGAILRSGVKITADSLEGNRRMKKTTEQLIEPAPHSTNLIVKLPDADFSAVFWTVPVIVPASSTPRKVWAAPAMSAVKRKR